MHSASFATGENVLQWEQLPFLKKMGKCALWGLRGRTPYKVIKCLLCILAQLPPPPQSNVPPPSSLSSKEQKLKITAVMFSRKKSLKRLRFKDYLRFRKYTKIKQKSFYRKRNDQHDHLIHQKEHKADDFDLIQKKQIWPCLKGS